jgi:hypothetical protein
MGNSGEHGLVQKFKVERLIPSSRGIDHSGCEYFVLDPAHDPLAYACLVEYARTAAQTGQHQLAADTFRWLADLAEQEGV